MSLRKMLICAALLNLIVFNAIAQTPKNDCACPVVKIIEPSQVLMSGEAATFTAVVSGYQGKINYNWTVTAGTIVEGQGTPSIKVDTTGLEGANITATLTIVGNWCPVCDNTTVSAIAVVESIPKPVLIEKFTRPNCEYVLMQMDNYMTHLQNDPSSVGYVIIYGKRGAVSFAEREMRNWTKTRNFDATRIVFTRGGGNNQKAEIELWLLPPGAEPPEVTAPESSTEPESSNESPAGNSKPFIFGSIFADHIGGCTTDYDLDLYAETLRTNSKMRGNIVIYEVSNKAFRKSEKEILDQLTKNGVARKKLKTFYVKVKPNQLREGVELWLLP